MKITSYKYKDKEYDFTLTMAAKAKINDLQFKMFDKIQNPEVFTLIGDAQTLAMEIEEFTKKKADAEANENVELASAMQTKIDELKKNQSALTMKMLPSMREYMGLMQEEVDPVEVTTILLECNLRYRDEMSDTLAMEILEDMEYSLGFVEFNKQMDEIIDKVFTTIALVQDNREKVLEKVKKPKEKIKDKMMN